MRPVSLILVIALMVFSVSHASELKLWYEKPAEVWSGGLPLGNGRLMTVVQGDRIGDHKYLAEARRLMFEGRYLEGEQLMQDHMQGLVLAFGMSTYQTSGDLRLRFDHQGEVRNYRRELDLHTAIASVQYQVGDVSYRREVFVSPVDQILVVQLSCDKPGQLSFDVELSRWRGIIK